MKLQDYIKGKRRGKEAQSVELEAMLDPLLSDAIEGYDKVPGDHEKALNRLHHSIIQHSAFDSKTAARKVLMDRRRRLTRNWSVVATALVLIGITTVTLIYVQPETRLDSPQQLISYDVEEIDFEQFSLTMAGHAVEFDSKVQHDNMGKPPSREKSEEVAEQLSTESLDQTMFEESCTTSVLFEATSEESCTTSALFEATSEESCTTSVLLKPAADTTTNIEFRHNAAPQRAKAIGVGEEVTLEFKVNKRGRPIMVKVVESPSRQASRQAKRILRKGCEWEAFEGKKRVTIKFQNKDKTSRNKIIE